MLQPFSISVFNSDTFLRLVGKFDLHFIDPVSYFRPV